MKLISFILLMCFSLNILADSNVMPELEKAFDDYQYAITVDWDQKDQNVYEQKTQEFYQTLAKLTTQKGLTSAAVLELAQKKLGNQKEFEAMKLRMSILTNKASSPEELAQILSDNAKDFYKQGASWSSEVYIELGVGLIVGITIAYNIWFDMTHTCAKYDTTPTCYKQGRRCAYLCAQWVRK
jgi:hypothetical protein